MNGPTHLALETDLRPPVHHLYSLADRRVAGLGSQPTAQARADASPQRRHLTARPRVQRRIVLGRCRSRSFVVASGSLLAIRSLTRGLGGAMRLGD